VKNPYSSAILELCKIAEMCDSGKNPDKEAALLLDQVVVDLQKQGSAAQAPRKSPARGKLAEVRNLAKDLKKAGLHREAANVLRLAESMDEDMGGDSPEDSAPHEASASEHSDSTGTEMSEDSADVDAQIARIEKELGAGSEGEDDMPAPEESSIPAPKVEDSTQEASPAAEDSTPAPEESSAPAPEESSTPAPEDSTPAPEDSTPEASPAPEESSTPAPEESKPAAPVVTETKASLQRKIAKLQAQLKAKTAKSTKTAKEESSPKGEEDSEHESEESPDEEASEHEDSSPAAGEDSDAHMHEDAEGSDLPNGEDSIPVSHSLEEFHHEDPSMHSEESEPMEGGEEDLDKREAALKKKLAALESTIVTAAKKAKSAKNTKATGYGKHKMPKGADNKKLPKGVKEKAAPKMPKAPKHKKADAPKISQAERALKEIAASVSGKNSSLAQRIRNIKFLELAYRRLACYGTLSDRY
jgi:hypothetical protein